MSSILPKVTQPSVQQSGASFAVGSYLSPSQGEDIYKNYSEAIQLVSEPCQPYSSIYVQGALTGYRVLTSYSGEDWQILSAVKQMQEGRTSRGKTTTFGDGGLDIFRLLVQMNGDIAKVIENQ